MTRHYNVKLEYPGKTFNPVHWETQDTSIEACRKRLTENCERFYPPFYGTPKLTITPKGE